MWCMKLAHFCVAPSPSIGVELFSGTLRPMLKHMLTQETSASNEECHECRHGSHTNSGLDSRYPHMLPNTGSYVTTT